MSPKIYFHLYLETQTEVCHGLWTGPYLSLRKMSIFVTVATKVASTKWVIEHHPCFLAINFQKNPKNTSNLQKNGCYHPLSLNSLESGGRSKREYPRGGSMRKTCFLFHRSTVDLQFHTPHKRFHHGATPNFPFSSPTPPLLTHTFGNSLTSSSTSLKKRAQLWQHPQAPMIAPSYPHFCQMTELSNTPANQLITATIGN